MLRSIDLGRMTAKDAEIVHVSCWTPHSGLLTADIGAQIATLDSMRAITMQQDLRAEAVDCQAAKTARCVAKEIAVHFQAVLLQACC